MICFDYKSSKFFKNQVLPTEIRNFRINTTGNEAADAVGTADDTSGVLSHLITRSKEHNIFYLLPLVLIVKAFT